jgi:RNA polymerase sigma factor (sigma-70 family)
MASNRRQAVVSGAPTRVGDESRRAIVATLVVEWQKTGRHEVFESLIEVVQPRLMRAIEAALLDRGIQDPAAVDDALSLVLNHLRRLPGTGADDRQVAKFAPAASHEGGRDPGWAYLVQLARSRARDVARDRRRQNLVFSQLEEPGAEQFEQTISGAATSGLPPLADRLREAARELEPRQRRLVELLIDGKSQAMIAHVLGLHEGTVSRLRARAIKSLRRILRS